MIPRVRPRISWEPLADLSQIPLCRAWLLAVTPRVRQIISARASSTTLRVLENGALKTAMPCPAAAARSIWLVPMQNAPIAIRSVTAGTLFDRRRTPLTVWFQVCWEFATAKDGVSALAVKRTLQIGSYQTAW